jgi:hypothetical protein
MSRPCEPVESYSVQHLARPAAQSREPAALLADPRMQRLVNLLGQYGWRARDCARLLRALAEWYEPTGMHACAICETHFKPTRSSHRHCSTACRQRAWRRSRSAT